MREKITGLVLNVRKYNDRNNVVTIYSREHGRLSFLSASGSGKSSNARRARLQPLALIETETNLKASADLHRLGVVNMAQVWTDIYFHPVKRVIAMFISEFLYKLLHASMADEALFDFMVESFSLLDSMQENVADFHIPFLVSMLTYSGIQPDTSGYQPGHAFSFASGTFSPENSAISPFITGEEAAEIVTLTKIDFSNMKNLRLNSLNRRRILYTLLNYFSYHFPGLGSLKSPEVLREIFE